VGNDRFGATMTKFAIIRQQQQQSKQQQQQSKQQQLSRVKT
jgi:hypothetical protein